MQIGLLTVAAQIVQLLLVLVCAAGNVSADFTRRITEAMAAARGPDRKRAEQGEKRPHEKVGEPDAARLSEKQEKLEASREEVLRAARERQMICGKGWTTNLREEMVGPATTTMGRGPVCGTARDDFTVRCGRDAAVPPGGVGDRGVRVLKDYTDSLTSLARWWAPSWSSAKARPRGRAKAEGRCLGAADGPVRVEQSVPLEHSRAQPGSTRAISRTHRPRTWGLPMAKDEKPAARPAHDLGEQTVTVKWSAARFLVALDRDARRGHRRQTADAA